MSDLPLQHLPLWAVLPILALATYRIQRLVTEDQWLPSLMWREFLDKKAKPAQEDKRHNLWTELSELFHCGHCFGLWVAGGVFCEHFFLGVIPIFVYTIFAAAAVVSVLVVLAD